MSDIVRFVPRADRNAAANLEAFIRFAREDLTAFGGEGGAWDSNRWKYRETVALFGTLTQRNTMHALIPFEDPFLQFAKAYIRYRYSHDDLE